MALLESSSGQSPPRLAAEPVHRGTHLSCHSESHPSLGPAITILFLGGEIDTTTVSTAADALRAAIDQAPGPLVVDLAALTFCSAAGVSLFCSHTATAEGHVYALAGLSRHILRVIDLAWSADAPECYSDTATAATALRRTAAGSPPLPVQRPTPATPTDNTLEDSTTSPEEQRLWEDIRRLGSVD